MSKFIKLTRRLDNQTIWVRSVMINLLHQSPHHGGTYLTVGDTFVEVNEPHQHVIRMIRADSEDMIDP